MFAAEYEPVDPASRRRTARAAVELDAHVEPGGLARALCKVIDLSTHGARLQTYSALLRGQTIRLTLPGYGTLAAEVMWADDFGAGCRFHHPLPRRAFERIVVG